MESWLMDGIPNPQEEKKKKKKEAIIGLPSFILEFNLNLHLTSLNFCFLSNDVLTDNLACCVLLEVSSDLYVVSLY
jgi:hypothetical protein